MTLVSLYFAWWFFDFVSFVFCSRENLANQRALVTLLTLTDWVAESPKFRAPLVIDMSLARARRCAFSLWAALSWSKLKWRAPYASAGDCCCRRLLEGASSALFLCQRQRSWELRTLSHSKDKSSVIGSNFAASKPDRTKALSLAIFC